MTAPGQGIMVHVDSKSPVHRDMFKTLDLLKIESMDGPVYFIVEGCAVFEGVDEMSRGHAYFYETHTCPTNFIRIEAVFTHDNDHPHGVFEHVRSIWLTTDYVEAVADGRGKEWLRKAFPETFK